MGLSWMLENKSEHKLLAAKITLTEMVTFWSWDTTLQNPLSVYNLLFDTIHLHMNWAYGLWNWAIEHSCLMNIQRVQISSSCFVISNNEINQCKKLWKTQNLFVKKIFPKSLLYTVFPHIVASATILSWIHKSLKILYSFLIKFSLV